jgi:hypothetical protein
MEMLRGDEVLHGPMARTPTRPSTPIGGLDSGCTTCDSQADIHFSDIAFANRNETKHPPYGEGTLRAEPLRQALTAFERPATVISESPDEASSQAIRTTLTA